jgi:hypothetical protein
MPPVCTNTTNSPANCGACGMKCGQGMICTDSKCACPGQSEMCGGDAGARACVNTKRDKNNCGTCGNICEAGRCMNGACQ